eukprot:CAMPEP_0171322260 /NCGR_PEP_ID=MMETSP0816-20121228/114850_1 /TAXON_ID=420281 /ORGANISM="Proboscia inermis, Strain CCAP1064/1" /LENGTH=42 /DNA_ID= /DNA_START= /DNA_END= /DNA_ORIENTATION=
MRFIHKEDGSTGPNGASFINRTQRFMAINHHGSVSYIQFQAV